MKVSVVVATKDAGNTLDRCLASVRGQNHPEVEIVVVDNRSSDDTVDVARRYADVVLLGGPERSAQRNAGARAASGDVLLFVDADMVLEPGVAREAVDSLQDRSASAVVVPERSFGDGFWARCKAMEKELVLGDPAVEAARAFRSADFGAVGGYDEQLTACEDWDLADRVAATTQLEVRRTTSIIWHDEGQLRLAGTFGKKRYYGRWVSDWLRSAPAHRTRRAVRSKLPTMLRRPVTAGGLVLMKLVEAAGFAMGMRDARRMDPTAPAPSEAAERRAIALSIATVAVAAAAMVQSWFRPGAFVSSGDNGPWMRGLDGITRSWGQWLTGTGSSGYPSSWLVEGAAHDALTWLGLSEPAAQRVWYSMVLAACGAAVAFFAAAFTRRPAPVMAAGLIAVLAPFHITTLPNLLPITAICSMSLIGGILARLIGTLEVDAAGVSIGGKRFRPVPPAIGALVALWSSHLAKNPPLLVLLAVFTGCAAVATVAYDRSTLRPVLRFGAWFTAASMFWVVPLGLHYALGTPGLSIVAETDVGAWSWAQRHSGPANAVTLVASWVWGDPDILSATARLAGSPWNYLRWGLPVAALASVPLARNRRLAGLLAVAAGGLVVLSVGVNAPFAPINEALVRYVPGFWLFRQPMSKFGVLLVVLYALLVALGLDGLLHRSPSWRPAARRFAGVVAVALAAMTVAFSHPLYDGSVIPGQRGGNASLPPARVEVPDSWLRAGRWLDTAPKPGSVIVLPLSDYYQRGTTWGYYGVDDLMWRVTRRSSLYLLPGGYYEPAGSAPALMTALEDAVAAHDDAGVERLSTALGVSYVAIRTDYRTTPGRVFRDGAQLVGDADASAALRRAATFEHVKVYETTSSATGGSPRSPDRSPGGSVDGGVTLVDAAASLPPARFADVVAATPTGTIVVDDDGAVGSADAWLPTDTSTHEVVTSEGTQRFAARPRTPLVWRATPAVLGGRRGIEVSLVSNMSVDGAPIIDAPPVVLAPARPVVGLVVGDRVVPVGDEAVLFEAVGGVPVRALVEGERMGLDADTFEAPTTQLGNCNNPGGLDLTAAGIDARFDARFDGRVGASAVTLSAASGSACLALPLAEALLDPALDTDDVRLPPIWRVRAQFDRLSGVSTRLCLWLPGVGSCAVGNPPSTTESAGTVDVLTSVVRGDPEALDGAQLVLYADHTDADGAPRSSTTFSDVSVTAVVADGEIRSLPEVGTAAVEQPEDGGRAGLTAARELVGNRLLPLGETAADCNNYDDAPATATRLAARPLPDEPGRSVELRARRHSACVGAPVDVPTHLHHVTVRFEYRSVRGSGARWCLMGPSDTCVAGGSLPAEDGWTEMTKDVVLPRYGAFDAPRPGAYRLYLYSDGAGKGEPSATTVTRYREVFVGLTYPVVAVSQPVREPLEARLVTNSQAWAPGWSIESDRSGAAAQHLRVDGWANGWLLADGPAEPRGAAARATTFRYWPDHVAAAAVWSLVPILVLAVFAAARARRREARR